VALPGEHMDEKESTYLEGILISSERRLQQKDDHGH
jgi:hypothetical protein